MIMNLKKENLFLMEHINEEERLLEEHKKRAEQEIKAKENKLNSYVENLKELEKQLESKKQRSKFYEKKQSSQKKTIRDEER